MCYFHLVIQGWDKHVKPYITLAVKENDILQQKIAIIRKWVKSWFFNIELKIEYHYSKRFFHKWLNDIRDEIGTNLCDSISNWIKTSLDPYEPMWVNYLKNDICSYECRTTSVAESMHSSMKTEYEGARSNFSLHKSANIMLDKSKRKHEDAFRLTAQKMNSHRSTGDSYDALYLTDYAYKLLSNQSSLSKSCRAIQYDPNTYLVYTPDSMEKVNSLPSRFFRLRTVKILNEKSLSCSCGFQIRNKMPCRHILCLLTGYHQSMFGVRWFNVYQYAFERKGFETLTNLFRQIEQDEYSKVIISKYPIYVGDLLIHNEFEQFPFMFASCTNYNKNEILNLKKAQEMNICVVRGVDIDKQISDKMPNEDNGQGCISFSLSQETEQMVYSDFKFNQNTLNNTANNIEMLNESIEHITSEEVNQLRSLMKVLEGNNTLINQFKTEFRELRNKYTNMISKKYPEIASRQISFPYTGNCHKKHDPRKGP